MEREESRVEGWEGEGRRGKERGKDREKWGGVAI